MNTSSEAIKVLNQAQAQADSAVQIIQNLIAAHDYQDVAAVVAQAAAQLLEAARRLMESDDTAAFAALESADDLLDTVYDIIEADLSDED